MNGSTIFLLSATSMTALSFAILWFQNRKKITGLHREEEKLKNKVLSSSKLSWKKVGTVKDIVYYPLKSGKGKSVEQCEFGTYGISKQECGTLLMRDRMFVVYNEKTGKFQTGRQYPKLLLVNIFAVDEKRAQLEVENMTPLTFNLPRPSNGNVKVTECFMWMGESVECLDCGSEVSEWLSKFLTDGKTNLRLGMGIFNTHRKITDGAYKEFANVYRAMRDEDSGLFSDLASYMVMSEASINDLNSRLKKSVSMSRFRPNVIVKDCEPYAEDQWEWIKIGDRAIIRNFKPCTRCTMTTIDPDTGIPDLHYEPLKTLRTYRKLKSVEMDMIEGHAPAMGIYCGLYCEGEVRVGDEVCVYQTDDLTD